MLWAGALTRGGYSHIIVKRDGKWTSTTLHRELYMAEIGDIPEGYAIDHLCGVRHCINTEHLEAVTYAENNRRSREATSYVARNRYGLQDKTHCIRGHERNEVNTYVKPDGTKACRACKRKSGEAS